MKYQNNKIIKAVVLIIMESARIRNTDRKKCWFMAHKILTKSLGKVYNNAWI